MKRILTIIACCAAGAAHGAPALTRHVPGAVARGTAPRIGAAPASQEMELAISLPLRDEAGLAALLRDIYDPASPRFRQYLSVAEFTARFGPSETDYAAVQNFAVTHHLQVRQGSANRRVVDVHGSVADIDSAFHVTIGLYRHPTEARVFFAPDREPAADLAVPLLHVSGLDDYVLPFTHLVRGGKGAVAHKSTGSGPDGNFIGSDIRAAYYGGTKLTGAGQSLGLLEYAGYNLADVTAYFAAVNQPFNVPIVGVSLNGSNLNCRGKCDDSEQVLDMQEAISMAPGLRQLVVYVGKTDVSMLNQMASDNTSKQLSSSWGWGADAATIDPIFKEFAAQGQSFVDATGDDGYLLLQDAVWPGDDQYVTGVGGTDLETNGPGGTWKREVGWLYSGGGPSPDHILIPEYQRQFIDATNNGSKKRRNVPDIAGDANLDNFSCYDGGCYTGNGGTSYAAPLWAGFIALANERAAELNKPPAGFLNPRIYRIGGSASYHKDFHDQVVGNNGRYIAEPGFDLVTGFGSPAGFDLIEALAVGK
jgi:kumamolisin